MAEAVAKEVIDAWQLVGVDGGPIHGRQVEDQGQRAGECRGRPCSSVKYTNGAGEYHEDDS